MPSSPESFRGVYKLLGKQEIDVDIYLPQPNSAKNRRKCPVLLNFHGGAFMLGSSKMVNRDQIQDCLNRGWVVLAPNHRLCPQVNLIEGPVQDSRDLLAWIYSGGLQKSIDAHSETHVADLDHVLAFGTSAGGTLALCLGFGVPRPVLGIYNTYGVANFANPLLRQKSERIAALIPKNLSPELLSRVFHEDPVPIEGGVSLEGQRTGGPDFTDPRQAYVQTQLANGTAMDVVLPEEMVDEIDPYKHLSSSFPPTFIAHGDMDTMVPLQISQDLYLEMRKHGIRCKLQIIPGEDHMFTARMKVGSQTWNLQREGFDFLEALIKAK